MGEAKNALSAIAGVEIYPIISLLIFFVFFVFLFLYVAKRGKHYFDDVANIPLNDETLSSQNKID